MGRKPRVEYSGAIYHVIQRGNNKEYIFYGDEDKLVFLREFEKRKISTEFKLYGYVIMGNHYHLVIQTSDEPLSKVMHLVNSSYSRYYNRTRGRTGHVFEGRYKAIPVQNERYLLAVLRYVHRNPVQAGMCKGVGGYRWSSDLYYRNNQGGFVEIDLLLDMLSVNRQEAVKKYNEFMEEEDNVNYDELDVLGDEAFMSMIWPKKEKPARTNLDEILLGTGVSAVDFELIKMSSRKRHLVPYKAAYIKEAVKHKYTLREIGANIGISYGAVDKLLNEK